ncbi:MAG TPA: peptidylprolyl isomerase [Candidatus Angelobacter sp.]|nr:peptidylprolyl isomerase [Candidatus Angelobacter sp.]
MLVSVAACQSQVAPQQPSPQQPATQPPATQQPPAQQPAQPQTTSPPATTSPSVSKTTATPAPATDPGTSVAPTEPVITAKGVCPNRPVTKAAPGAPKPAPAPCQTVVTKGQFEKLVNAVSPSNQNVPPAMRRNLAQAYVELLAYAQAAEKAGVDKDPKFIEVMRLVRMRTLADIYRRDMEEKYRTPPPNEIQAYYDQNVSKYEEIKLSRIFIPAKNPSAQDKDAWEKKAAQLSTELHDRAAKGEDLEKLQKEAYTTLGLTIAPPNTTVGTRRRGMMAPQEEQELFALKPGDVSKVEQEPAGYIIYKIESRQTLPVDQVKDEISRELYRQKIEAQIKAITATVRAEFNDQYFGSPASPASPAVAPVNRPSGGAVAPPKPAVPPVNQPATPPQSQPSATQPPAQSPPK